MSNIDSNFDCFCVVCDKFLDTKLSIVLWRHLQGTLNVSLTSLDLSRVYCQCLRYQLVACSTVIFPSNQSNKYDKWSLPRVHRYRWQYSNSLLLNRSLASRRCGFTLLHRKQQVLRPIIVWWYGLGNLKCHHESNVCAKNCSKKKGGANKIIM